MIDLVEAVEIAKNNISDKCRILGYTEMSDKYTFNVAPRRWDGDPRNRPSGGYTDYVDKIDGKFYSVMTDELLGQMINEMDNGTLKIDEVDISVYLSEEDEKFMKELKAKQREDS